MRKIIITTFITLDGVLQAPGGPEEDLSQDFKWGGWTAPLGDEKTNGAMMNIMKEPFDLLLGRKTYDIFASYWPNMDHNPIGKKFNSIQKFVVSHHPLELSWKNSNLITGDVVAELKKLKAQDGPDLLLHGSSELVQTLLANELADRLHLWTYPVTIGEGKRLFREGTQARSWKLVDSTISTTGVIMATYEPAGGLKTGTVGA